MVASLQSKKEALETKLRDKTSELRKLCIEEAELTGVLPTETPLEPGESPPQFRRRVGTAFTYPESLINKLRSKEDEALAALELECKIQTGIAEAAKGLANDGTASKSVRRKHRLLYEDSQRRLSELEARLAAYRQAQPKQKKKPRPLTEFDETVHHDVDEVDSARFPSAPSLLPDRNPSTSLRHSHTYGGLSKQDFNMYPHHHRVALSQMHLPVADYRYNLMEHHHHYSVRSNNPSPIDYNVSWNKGRDVCNNHHQLQINQYGYSTGSSLHDNYHAESISMSNFSDRFGSLDRTSHYSEASDSENRTAATLPRNSTTPHSTASVLLPNQTYPESSLMRTQSLGNMENLKQQADRKNKEKEWYETSLDSSPAVSKPDSPFNPKSVEMHSTPPPLSPAPESPMDNCMVKANQALISNIHFDTVVPYESPKNHTVVQAGKWQPYREVTKPFEMSDFYKYSTKYRQQSKGQPMPSQPSYQGYDLASTQHKGIYKAPMPLECQPLSSTCENSNNTLPPSSNVQRYDEHSPTEAVSWYRNKNIPKPRSSTLV